MNQNKYINLKKQLLTIIGKDKTELVLSYMAKTPYDQNKVHKVSKKGYKTICIEVDHYEKEDTITTLYMPI